MVAHRRLSDRGVGEFRQDAPIQTPRRVALLARGPTVLVQNFVDEGAHHAELRPGPRRIAVRRGTPNFAATPAIVPIPNSCPRRSCSNKSILAFQATPGPPIQSGRP